MEFTKAEYSRNLFVSLVCNESMPYTDDAKFEIKNVTTNTVFVSGTSRYGKTIYLPKV